MGLPPLECFGGGATSVCDDSMPEEFEDNAESVLDMLESTDLVIEEDRPLSLKENMTSYRLENCVGLRRDVGIAGGDVLRQQSNWQWGWGDPPESRVEKQKPGGIESAHWVYRDRIFI